MRKDNILLLHVGTPKTGTSTLQTFLYENEKSLLENDWVYPNLYGVILGKPDLHVRNGLVLNDSVGTRKSGVVWAQIKQQLRRYNVIISGEDLWEDTRGISLEDRLKVFIRHYKNIYVLVYLRRQDYYVESMWNYDIKTNKTPFDICEYLKTDECATEQTEYLKKLISVEKIIGKNRIIVRPFEKEQLQKGDIRYDFLHVMESLSHPIDTNRFLFKQSENKGLSDGMLSLAMEFYKVYYKYADKPSVEIIECFDKLNDSGIMGYEKRKYLDKDTREEFLKRYQESNEEIARRYLNRNDGNLFYDQRVDFPIWEKRNFQGNERIIEIIAYSAAMTKRRTEIDYRYPIGVMESIQQVVFLLKYILKRSIIWLKLIVRS